MVSVVFKNFVHGLALVIGEQATLLTLMMMMMMILLFVFKALRGPAAQYICAPFNPYSTPELLGSPTSSHGWSPDAAYSIVALIGFGMIFLNILGLSPD